MNDESDSLPATVEWAKELRGASSYTFKECERVAIFAEDCEVSINAEAVNVYPGSGDSVISLRPMNRARFLALLLGLGVEQEGGEG
jgi:hypothetical protein